MLGFYPVGTVVAGDGSDDGGGSGHGCRRRPGGSPGSRTDQGGAGGHGEYDGVDGDDRHARERRLEATGGAAADGELWSTTGTTFGCTEN